MPKDLTMRSMTKTDAAFEELRRLIYAGTLAPGQRLKVAELIEMLEMSPTPIREALRLLQAAGLVVHESHRGAVVRRSFGAQNQDAYELRTVLEPFAAEKAAANASNDQLAGIEQLYAQLRALAAKPTRTKGALEKITASHGALFRAIFEAANNKILIEFIAQLRPADPTGQPMHQWEDTLQEQGNLVAAIASRDPARAKEAMTAYLTHVRALTLALADKISASEAGRGVDSP
jgi:DNA-binding GntR family transcriptional regulator